MGGGVLVTQQGYRDAMARLGAAVNVITTDGPGGKRGFTASAVCSVTDSPPTLLVCLNRNSDSNEALKLNQVACINVLKADQEHLSPVFAGMTEGDYAERFGRAVWGVMETGCAVLEGALASFDCRIVEVTEKGTHSVFFCEVMSLQVAPVGQGLVYFGRRYHALDPAS